MAQSVTSLSASCASAQQLWLRPDVAVAAAQRVGARGGVSPWLGVFAVTESSAVAGITIAVASRVIHPTLGLSRYAAAVFPPVSASFVVAGDHRRRRKLF